MGCFQKSFLGFALQIFQTSACWVEFSNAREALRARAAHRFLLARRRFAGGTTLAHCAARLSSEKEICQKPREARARAFALLSGDESPLQKKHGGQFAEMDGGTFGSRQALIPSPNPAPRAISE